MESGFCSSEPMSNENSSGTIAKMVVSDVMMMGRSLLRPASWMASSNGIPALRNSLMASSFRMESLMMIPHVTISPMRHQVQGMPAYPQQKQGKRHIYRNFQQHDERLHGLSNWAARMKYIARTEMKRITTSSSSIWRLEKKLPEKAVSQSPVASASASPFPSTPEHRPLHRNGTVYIHRCVLP